MLKKYGDLHAIITPNLYIRALSGKILKAGNFVFIYL